jgi:hypothetical protein
VVSWSHEVATRFISEEIGTSFCSSCDEVQQICCNQVSELLPGLVDEYQSTPGQIYNCDVTGISTDTKSQSNVILTKGREQVGAQCLS